jgi:hypothetical protein
MLPLQVLSNRQRALIDALCVPQQFLATHPTDAVEEFAIIGSVERRPPVEVETLPSRCPNASVVGAVASLVTDFRLLGFHFLKLRRATYGFPRIVKRFNVR